MTETLETKSPPNPEMKNSLGRITQLTRSLLKPFIETYKYHQRVRSTKQIIDDINALIDDSLLSPKEKQLQYEKLRDNPDYDPVYGAHWMLYRSLNPKRVIK